MVMATFDETDFQKKIEITIKVQRPKTCMARDGSPYTSYAVFLESNHPCFSKMVSISRRRYSEFVHLRKLLSVQHPTVAPPALPPKHFFHRFDPEFVEERRKGLEIFLQKVMDINVYLSNKSIHMFLQSNSTMAEIESNVCYEMPLPFPRRERSLSASSWSSEEELCTPAVECTEDLDILTLKTKLKKIPVVSSEIKTSSHDNLSTLPYDETDSKNLLVIPPQCPLSHPDLLKLKKSSPIPFSILRKSSSKESLNSLPESDQFKCGSSPDSKCSSSPESDRVSQVRKVSFCRKITVAKVFESNWQIAIKPINDVQ